MRRSIGLALVLAALVVPAQHASAQLAQKKVLTLAPSLGTASTMKSCALFQTIDCARSH